MDHGPAFQALWTRLRREVRQLQDKGYYGDGSCLVYKKSRYSHLPIGYWSSGTRLADSVRVSGDGIESGDLPEYMVRKNPVSRVTDFNLSCSAVVHKLG